MWASVLGAASLHSGPFVQKDHVLETKIYAPGVLLEWPVLYSLGRTSLNNHLGLIFLGMEFFFISSIAIDLFELCSKLSNFL